MWSEAKNGQEKVFLHYIINDLRSFSSQTDPQNQSSVSGPPLTLV